MHSNTETHTQLGKKNKTWVFHQGKHLPQGTSNLWLKHFVAKKRDMKAFTQFVSCINLFFGCIEAETLEYHYLQVCLAEVSKKNKQTEYLHDQQSNINIHSESCSWVKDICWKMLHDVHQLHIYTASLSLRFVAVCHWKRVLGLYQKEKCT